MEALSPGPGYPRAYALETIVSRLPMIRAELHPTGSFQNGRRCSFDPNPSLTIFGSSGRCTLVAAVR
jgi:hypothetical protein